MGSSYMAMMQTNAIMGLLIFLSISFFTAIIALGKKRTEDEIRLSEKHVDFYQMAHREKLREVQTLARQRENEFNYLRQKKLQNEKQIMELEMLSLQREMAEKSAATEETSSNEKPTTKKLVN